MFLSSWILSSSFPKTWGDEAPKLLPWDANDNHHCHLNLKCTLVSGPHHDNPWKLIILSQHRYYHWSLRPLPFLMFQSLSVSGLFPRPPSARGGLRPAGVCSSRHSHNHQHSPAPQYHYLSSPQNHHSQSLSRFSQLSKPTITIVPSLLLSTTGTSAQRLSSLTQSTPLQREPSQTHSLPRAGFRGWTCKRSFVFSWVVNSPILI